ncbi:MAG: DedA family protein [Paracoccaceae bacterium]
MENVVSTVVEFVSAHRAWAPLIVGIFAFAETMALIFLVIPSTAILFAIGGLVAAGALDFGPVWLGASVGAVIGPTVSYWIGWRYGDAALDRWPLNRRPQTVARGMALFRRWGVWAVLVGHFFGPLRSIAFLGAGAASMGWLVFQAANIPGAILWAYLTPKAGELGGNALAALWRMISP